MLVFKLTVDGLNLVSPQAVPHLLSEKLDESVFIRSADDAVPEQNSFVCMLQFYLSTRCLHSQ